MWGLGSQDLGSRVSGLRIRVSGFRIRGVKVRTGSVGFGFGSRGLTVCAFKPT